MDSGKSRVWLITGASRGLGLALAEAALAAGDRVVMAVRDPVAVQAVVASHPAAAAALRLDVAEPAKIAAAIAAAEAPFGPIDILMSNAGYVVVGTVEEVTPPQYRAVFETNFFGALEVLRETVPRMRARGRGHIMVMSAMGGFVSSGGLSYYCATKAALESICEALAQEMAPFGVHVTIVQPGNFRTGVLDAHVAAAANSVYRGSAAHKLRERFATTSGMQMGDPRRLAEACIAVTREPEPPLRLPLGRDAVERIRAKLAQVGAELAAYEATALGTDFPIKNR
ncbi:MAG: SDR family NAD(P)-dependent oxidoreductase [Alphaproteobacteria bacterium]|nr:SDR family NAD(P)-dependent oxidoreductase [Alphaproteobacteria bacterium]